MLSLKETGELVMEFEWLTKCIVDFFIHDVQVPVEWLSVLSELSCSDLVNMAAFNYNLPETWPESLQIFINKCSLCMDAKFKGTPAKLMQPLVKGLSLKKQHEVGLLAPLINECSVALGITSIIDMGAGHGYLDRCLVHQYALDVVAVECNPKYSITAHEKSESLRSLNSFGNSGRLSHVNRKVVTTDRLDNLTDENTIFSCMICGLHTCGE